MAGHPRPAASRAGPTRARNSSSTCRGEGAPCASTHQFNTRMDGPTTCAANRSPGIAGASLLSDGADRSNPPRLADRYRLRNRCATADDRQSLAAILMAHLGALAAVSRHRQSCAVDRGERCELARLDVTCGDELSVQ